MDPLSITAGIIAIIQAINKSISICFSFRAALKESPSGLTRIIEETRSLRDIFEALQLAIDNNVNTQSTTGDSAIYEKIWNAIKDVLPQCETVLNDLDKELGTPVPATSGPVKTKDRVAAAVRWQWKEPQVISYLERLERCKSRLSLGLSVHQSTLLLEMRETTISWYAKVEASHSRIEDKLDAITARKSDEDDIVNWLSPIKVRASHLEVVAQHQAGTSSWVNACDEFEKWYHGDARLLWLNGPPSMGKTQLFAHILEHLIVDTASNPDQPVVAYAYCDFRRSESLRSSNILGSIVTQCCTATFSISEAIRTAFKASKTPGHDAPPSLTLLKEAISEILQNKKIFILIDGLDESQQATEVGDFLHEICSENFPAGAKVLVTGRKIESLEQLFSNDLQIQLSHHKKEVREDIQVYIDGQFQSDRRLQWLNVEIREHISETLVQDSNAMFRWVQCQLVAISPLRSLKAIRQALHELPMDLENTYSRILASIPQHSAPTMRNALEWLSFSLMSLSLAELHEILAVEPGTSQVDNEARLCSPMDILTLGNSLFDLSSSGHIHLAHLSVRDYLLAPSSVYDGRKAYFHLNMHESHRNLTLRCLTYLLLEAFKDGPARTAEDYAKRLQQFPFLKYAASAWPYHAQLGFSPLSKNSREESKATDDETMAVILEFFHPRRRANFIAWVQVINANYNFKWDIYPRNATPLYYAASFGLDSVVERLLSSPEFNGTDLNAPGSRYGGTPVHAAAYRQHSSTLRILLDAGANAAKADFNGVTPLHSAAANGDLVTIRMLLDGLPSEAAANAKDNLGETPYDWAMGATQAEAAELLRSRPTNDATKGKGLEVVTTELGQRDRTQQQQLSERAIEEVHSAGLEIERSVSPPLGILSQNQPVSYFPDFYAKRSGLDSSIVMGVNKGL